MHDDPPVLDDLPVLDEDDVAEDEIREDCLMDGTWGVFCLTAKKSNSWSPPVGWQVRCPFHK